VEEYAQERSNSSDSSGIVFVDSDSGDPRTSPFRSLDLMPLIAERLAAKEGLAEEEIIRVGEKRVGEKCALVAA
jgi:hypothetical protein